MKILLCTKGNEIKSHVIKSDQYITPGHIFIHQLIDQVYTRYIRKQLGPNYLRQDGGQSIAVHASISHVINSPCIRTVCVCQIVCAEHCLVVSCHRTNILRSETFAS